MFEPLTHPWWLFILVGLVSGIFSSTFGVGSGIILVPTLVLIFSLPQKSAQGACLAVMVPMALVGAIRYVRNPDISVNFTLVLVLAVGAIIGAWIGSGIVGRVPALTLRKLFAVVMIAAAVQMLMPPKEQRGASPPSPPSDTQPEERADVTLPSGGDA